MKENNFNIININVNNFIINNKDIKNNANNNKVFSKIGNEIIDGKNLFNNDNKKNKIQTKMNRGKPSVSVQKKPVKEKYELSNIQSVINELMEETNSPPPSFDNNLNLNQNQIQNQNNNEINNNLKKINNLNSNANKENQLSQNIDEKIMETHFKLWEILVNMELHAENKIGLSNQVKKMFSLMETEIIVDVNNKNRNIGEIFNNNQLNLIYNKTIKIGLILSIYIKFILLDFNFELTIKSNIKRLSSLINENLLSILCSQVFIKDNIQENYLCSNIKREFIDQYTRLIKLKKIRKNAKEQLNNFCRNINRNLDIAISSIKQFSNNLFKIGYFNPIHNICFDMFRLIDTYKIVDISNIIINYIFFYVLHSNQSDKKNSSTKILSFGSNANSLAALGFINVPSPYLEKLPPEVQNSTYTLVLDLDETLVHFVYTPSGGIFLIRTYCLQFLEEMSKIFEIIIFTAALKDYADSILDILDPHKKLIKYRLYRQHTSVCGITFCKDLSKIGRDLEKSLIVDNLPDNFKLQPNNGIHIWTWIDDIKDTQLNDLGKILKDLVSKQPPDVRPIIKKLKDDINKKMRNNMNTNPFKGVDISKYFK
jgi:Dullard-like phosphatase family protein